MATDGITAILVFAVIVACAAIWCGMPAVFQWLEAHGRAFAADDSKGSSWGRGMLRDIKRRAPFYIDDWTSGHNAKTTASIFYMFFTSIAPAITFAEVLDRETGKIGVVEVCLSSCLSGVIFSVFGGQPMCIVGVTGPVTILTISIYVMARSLNISFLHFYMWAQIWAGLMHMAAAFGGWCDKIKYERRRPLWIAATVATCIVRGRIAAPPRLHLDSPSTGRGGAAATTWIVRGGSWRRRGVLRRVAPAGSSSAHA